MRCPNCGSQKLINYGSAYDTSKWVSGVHHNFECADCGQWLEIPFTPAEIEALPDFERERVSAHRRLRTQTIEGTPLRQRQLYHYLLMVSFWEFLPPKPPLKPLTEQELKAITQEIINAWVPEAKRDETC